MYTVVHKKLPTNLRPHLRQILTDLKNSFTGTHCGQCATTWLL